MTSTAESDATIEQKLEAMPTKQHQETPIEVTPTSSISPTHHHPLPPPPPLLIKAHKDPVYFDRFFLIIIILYFLVTSIRCCFYFHNIEAVPIIDVLFTLGPLLLRLAMLAAVVVASFTNKTWYTRYRYSIISSIIIIHYFAPRAEFVKRSAIALGGLPPGSGGVAAHAKELMKILFWSKTTEMMVTIVALPLPLPLAPLTFVLPLLGMSINSENVCLAPFLDNPIFAGKIAWQTKILDSVTLSGFLKWAGLLKTQEYNAQRQCEVWFSFYRIVLGGVIPHMIAIKLQLIAPLRLLDRPRADEQQDNSSNGNVAEEEVEERESEDGSVLNMHQQPKRDDPDGEDNGELRWLRRADDYCWSVWTRTNSLINSSVPPFFLWFIWISAIWGVLAPALASLVPQE